MANEEHLAILGQGVAVWNEWRQSHRGVRPDLAGADLKGADLREVDFRAAHLALADLSGADLIQADLRGADLREADLITARLLLADLSGADLYLADLADADLSGAYLLLTDLPGANLLLADLTSADLTGADLSGVDLRGADLSGSVLMGASLQGAHIAGANLRGADLNRTDFTGATAGWNIFGAGSLRSARGLETIEHTGPSTIGIDTLYASAGQIPAAFLRGAGIPEPVIEGFSALLTRPIPPYTCFLAHVREDEALAGRLGDDLESRSVRCWHYRFDLYGGRFRRKPVSEAVQSQDRLVLVCSRHTVWSPNIVREILETLDLEEKTGLQKLFPVLLDRSLFSPELAREVESGEWRRNWLKYLTSRPSPDFSRWQDPASYREAFRDLLRTLENPAPLG